MKYFFATLKYIKSNFWIWIAFAVAVVAFGLLIDLSSIDVIKASFDGDKMQTEFIDWLNFFLPFNITQWWSYLLSALSLIMLIVVLAFISTSTDRRMRYNARSIKGLLYGMEANVYPCFWIIAIIAVGDFITTLLMSTVMQATVNMNVENIYILGIILCCILALVALYVLTFLELWLPCYLITGYKAYEALNYSYSLYSTNKLQIFLSTFVPIAILALCATPVVIFCDPIVISIVVPIVAALIFTYIAVHCFVVYIDADGIVREDLKKY